MGLSRMFIRLFILTRRRRGRRGCRLFQFSLARLVGIRSSVLSLMIHFNIQIVTTLRRGRRRRLRRRRLRRSRSLLMLFRVTRLRLRRRRRRLRRGRRRLWWSRTKEQLFRRMEVGSLLNRQVII